MIENAKNFFELNSQRDKYFQENIKPFPQLCAYAPSPAKIDESLLPNFDWPELDDSMIRGFDRAATLINKTLPASQVNAFWVEIEKKHPALTPYVEFARLQSMAGSHSLTNYLKNPSFEDPPAADQNPQKKEAAKDWLIYHNRMNNAKVVRDENVFHQGKAAVLAQGLTDYSGVCQTVTAPNHRCYRLSFWYKTSNDTRHGAVTIMCDPPVRAHFDPSGEWKRYEKIFRVDQGTGPLVSWLIIISLRHGATEDSKLWLDDARLEMLSPEGVVN